MRSTSPQRDLRTVISMLAALLVPVYATLHLVAAPPPWTAASPDPTPYGYTVSLSLFAVPVAMIVAWHVRHPEHPHHRRALLASAAVITVMGFILDIVFGSDFFVFRNTAATLGVRLPAWNWTTRAFIADYLPIEEFAFYLLGALFIIGFYSWADAAWLPDLDRNDYATEARSLPRIVRVSWTSVVALVGLVGAGFAIKAHVDQRPGIPGYYLFLVGLGLLPASLCVRSVGRFINWRAFTFSYVALLLVSLVWEVTLAVPYEWWNYQPQHMLGVRIRAWSELPIEAVLVWLTIARDSIIAYEVCRVYLHMDRPLRGAVFGQTAAASASHRANVRHSRPLHAERASARPDRAERPAGRR